MKIGHVSSPRSVRTQEHRVARAREHRVACAQAPGGASARTLRTPRGRVLAVMGVAAALGVAGGLVLAGQGTAGAQGLPAGSALPAGPPVPPPVSVDLPVLPIPARTAAELQIVPGINLSTPNAHEQRPAESISKIFVADAVLRGPHSEEDLADLRAMITASDDAAANRVQARHPGAIGETIARHGLAETTDTGHWGTMRTSVHDVSTLLSHIRAQDPGSPILDWMAHYAPVAADGTPQDWGTVDLPLVQGTKFGWSDYGPQNVATASYGPGFTVAANTWGSPADQTADLPGTGSAGF